MAAAFVFPGQGSQAVGMGKGLADAFTPARLVFEEVDAALGERLSDIIWNGPADTLMLTENAQPALMAVSLAAAARLLRIRGRAMQKAVSVGAGAMAALIGLELAEVKTIANEVASVGVCAAANDNGGVQV